MWIVNYVYLRCKSVAALKYLSWTTELLYCIILEWLTEWLHGRFEDKNTLQAKYDVWKPSGLMRQTREVSNLSGSVSKAWLGKRKSRFRCASGCWGRQRGLRSSEIWCTNSSSVQEMRWRSELSRHGMGSTIWHQSLPPKQSKRNLTCRLARSFVSKFSSQEDQPDCSMNLEFCIWTFNPGRF